MWHDGYVHVFRVVLFSESVVLSCGEAALSVGAVRAGFRRARGLSDGSENRPLIQRGVSTKTHQAGDSPLPDVRVH